LQFPWFTPYFSTDKTGMGCKDILSVVKANKGFKVDFMEQLMSVKVDLEGQESFNGLSQTVKFFLV